MKALSEFYDRLCFAWRKQTAPFDKQGFQLFQRRRRLKNEILAYYAAHPTQDESLQKAVNYLRSQRQAVFFNAPFKDAYEYRNLIIDEDEDRMPYWVMPDGKRLFFLRNEPDRVRMSINHLLIEQDAHSPHRYLTPEFNLGPDDVLADVGSAEGILSLMYVDRVKKVYLFESDSDWVEVLEKTFAPWAGKVKIVRKFVSDKDDDDNVRLDSFFEKEGVMPTFVKLDVEGAELSVLNGMSGLLKDSSSKMKIAACTYHLQDEYEQVTHYVKERDWRYETSEGWMLFGLYDNLRPPYFRHGLIRIWTNQQEG